MFMTVIEGADAVGKNTQTERLQKRLAKFFTGTKKISFPRYETPTGKMILAHLKKEVLLAEAGGRSEHDALMFQCLMLADKIDAVPEMLETLESGGAIVLDRYWHSAFCYGASDGLDMAWLKRVHCFLPPADVNILLDLPSEVALQRRPQMRDRYEENREQQELVRRLYRELWARESEPSSEKRIYDSLNVWRVVDASQPAEVVEREIWAIVLEAYNTQLADVTRWRDGNLPPFDEA